MTIYNYLKTNMAEKNISQEFRHYVIIMSCTRF